MRKLTAGLMVVAASVAFGAGGAGAQGLCPGSPPVACPVPVPEVPEVGGTEQERPAPEVGGIQQERPAPPEVAAGDRVTQPHAPSAQVAAAAPRNVAGTASLPVTGADVIVLAAAGASLIGGGGGLVWRARRLNARQR